MDYSINPPSSISQPPQETYYFKPSKLECLIVMGVIVPSLVIGYTIYSVFERVKSYSSTPILPSKKSLPKYSS